MKQLLRYGVILTILHAATAVAQGELRTISVVGTADKEVAPNQAILSISLVSKNFDLTVAKERNDEQAEQVLKISREFHIPKEKLANYNISINPEYNYITNEGKPHQEFTGYKVSRSIRITIDDLSIQEKIISALIAAKIDQVNNIQFDLSDKESAAGSLRLKAFDNAKAKANALALAAGSKLGKALTINTDGTIAPPIIRPVMMTGMRMEVPDLAAAVPSEAPSLPGMISLHETVSVVFAME